MHLRWLSGALAIAVGLVPLLGLSPSASASIGVGVQANPVSLGQVAHPGASYPLPSLYVVNTGTQAESMSARVERLSPGAAHTVPASWIHISALRGQLMPERSAQFSLELVLPSDAKPGTYQSDIVVSGSTAPVSAGINLGAAAATKLEFRITPAPGAGSWFSISAWKWGVIGGVVLLAAALLGWRRTGLRIRVERRTNVRSGMNRLGGHREP
jgi:hypothetical protein